MAARTIPRAFAKRTTAVYIFGVLFNPTTPSIFTTAAAIGGRGLDIEEAGEGHASGTENTHHLLPVPFDVPPRVSMEMAW